jgi:hypothetical protein
MEETLTAVYKFEDLAPEIQAEIIENEKRYIAEDPGDWWSDPVIEGLHEELKEAGLTDIETEWSGFWSQGDGASFTARVFNSENKKFLSEVLGIKVLDEVADNIAISITRMSSRYSHSRTMDANVEVDGDDEVEKDMGTGFLLTIDVTASLEPIEDALRDWARARADKLYKDLERAYNELFEDSSIREDIIARGGDYDEDGNTL